MQLKTCIVDIELTIAHYADSLSVSFRIFPFPPWLRILRIIRHCIAVRSHRDRGYTSGYTSGAITTIAADNTPNYKHVYTS